MSDGVFDAIRFLYLGLFVGGAAFMALTNVLSWKLLRPPHRVRGILWWHIATISISFLCLGSVALSYIYARLGAEPDWQFAAVGVGFGTFAIAQALIFVITRTRYAEHKARPSP